MIRLAGRLLPLALLLGWELLCRLGQIDARFVPAPSAILSALAAPGAAAELLGQSGQTLQRTLGGLLLGAGAGFTLGLACGASKRLDEALSPLAQLLRPVPSVAVIPLAVLFLGLGGAMNVAVTGFACLWPVFAATRDAARSVEGQRLDTARMHGLSPARIFLLVTLPFSLGGAALGVRTAVGVAVAVAVASEMVASPDGLGHLAVAASFSRQQALVWAAVLAMGLVGAVSASCLRLALGLAERRWPGLLGVPPGKDAAP